ncbi:MAG: hypothetical protein IPG71_08000 [bacterium]|nr:hypothetical protein [bacterium]
MRYLLTMCVVCTSMIINASQAVAQTDLRQQLQTARILLDQPSPDVEMLTGIGNALKSTVLLPDNAAWHDSTCRTIVAIERAAAADPQGNAWAIGLCTADPTAPWTKFALDYIWPYTAEPEQKLAAADVLLDQACRHPDQTWAGDFKAALFRAYATEELWLPASYIGFQLLEGNYPLVPEDQITLANALLRGNREEAARLVLDRLANEAAPNTPQALRARTELGLIEQVLHQEQRAKFEFEAAWAIWEKQRKKPGFNDPLVINSVARARWELLQFEFSALERTLQVSVEWHAKEAARWCRDFVGNTHELTDVSSAYHEAVAVLIGRVHRMEGDALFRLGMYSSRVEDVAARDRLLGQALAAYDRAADVFTLAGQREHKQIPSLSDGHWSAITTDFVLDARQRAYEVYAHAADQLLIWATADWSKTPLRSFGANGYTPRFNAIVHDAFPTLRVAADYRKFAWRYAGLHPSVEQIDLSVSSLYGDFLFPVAELRKLCESQWQSVAASSTQISRTLKATSNPDAVEAMTEYLAIQIAEARKLADESTTALDQLFGQLFASVPERDSLSTLAEHKLALCREYAAMNRTLHETLDEATNSLDRRDPHAASLRSHLYKYSSVAANVELASLEAGHEWAAANGFLLNGGKELYARLAERDPGRYPLRGAILQAGR